MTPTKKRLVVGKLRCTGCERAPTATEIEEMLLTFGAKMKPNENLVWKCRACADKGTLTYDEIHPTIRQLLGCHEGYRKVGFPAANIFVEPALSPGLKPDEMMCFLTLKWRGKEFRIGCGTWNKEDWDGLHQKWVRACEAFNGNKVPQADMDRISGRLHRLRRQGRLHHGHGRQGDRRTKELRLMDTPFTDEEIDRTERLYKENRDQFNAMARRLIVTIVGLRAELRESRKKERP